MKSILYCMIASVVLFGSRYEGSTTPAVILAGGIIKSTHIEPSDQKYKRKNCPVCKGTGKYLSGDGIKMVDCGYCEPETKDSKNTSPQTISPKVIEHPPVILMAPQAPQCTGPNCKVKR